MNELGNVRMVSASAGTGKTHYLTNVIADQIAAGVPASGVMATTFTKKAAGELKERIAARLLDAPKGTQDTQQLKDAAQQLSVSLIGTVNSVCSRLLTEYAIDAGLSPALEPIAEGEQDGIFHLATDSVLAEYSDRILPIARRMSMAEDNEWASLVRSICDAARNNLLAPRDLAGCAERSWLGYQSLLERRADTDDRPSWLHQFRQCLPDLQAVARSSVDSNGKSVNTTAASFTNNFPTIVDRITALTSVEDISWEQWRGVVPSGASAPIKRIFEGPVTAFKEGLLSNPAFHDDVEQFIRLVYACAAECMDAFAEFKRLHGVIDFIDQETLALKLVRDNEAFRSSFAQRVRFLVVDEFQDTSPLQLELFLQLSGLVEQAVWVGDPKQAIYAFRETDPELMNAVVAHVTEKRQLKYSWRSRQSVIDLSNAVFVPVFESAGMDPATVTLTITPDHAGWPAGSLEVWNRPAGKDGDRLAATAAGVADLLTRRELKPSDVAVLTRTNKEAETIAASLAALGVRASLNSQPLMSAREVQLARAAMAFVADAWDTVALTEIVALHPDHGSHQSWQQELLGSAEPSETLAGWAADPVCAALTSLRSRASRATPTEVFEGVVSSLNLPQLIKAWSVPETRLRNLDAVRAELNNYYEASKALRTPGTLRGSLRFLADADAMGAENSGDDVVNVLTYHKAKGLEWPVVVMESLDREVGARAFGTAVESDDDFDLSNPLAGRWIRFWPSPFPYGGSPLDTAAKSSDVLARNEARERRNAARLLYVGMTRSVSTTILTAKGPAPAGLNDLGIKSLVSWSGEGSEGLISIAGTAEPMPADVYTYTADQEAALNPGALGAQYTDVVVPRTLVEYPSARIQASKQQAGSQLETVSEHADLGNRLIPHGDRGWDAVGSAIHAFLGTEYGALAQSDQLGLAKQIVDRWRVGDLVSADVLLVAGERLADFLSASYPNAVQYREAPIAWRNEQDQVMEGWIDLLLEIPAGYVLIDHKSYPGQDPAGHIRDHYLGQMDTYRQAILAVTGKPVIEILIHLPALGKVYKVA
ncbi:UvrD-helicase domain-containing protein [Arthrobacter sp. MSA 4-2]|uniref:UvrD-helicase domain-containing protein n=1 Tax=Arthrobacter sp. MSA 4-2 TaxID=2794349 RepID=UPI0018E812F7|nr:UvrD-helicase domain-containing protein [Arthrobacter sp. MSA 4-2]MBJ2119416.1 UvrD-helicase domain-containing protein [Arthrobacter sp. MSA 4-2]